MKKYFTLLLLSLLSLVASAYDAKIDGIYYNLDKSKNTASVTYKELDNGYPTNDCSGNIVIPSEVTYEDVTYKVTVIEEKAFYNCGGLKSVTIPSSVKSIGASTFFNCKLLTSVDIPDGITIIRAYTFALCDHLTSIFIPNSVKYINYNAFQECTMLSSVFIPNSVKSIGDEAFSKCEALMSVIIPNSVEIIGKKAFYSCNNLNFVSLGSGIQTIGDEAFGSCTSLNTLHLLATTPPENVHPDAFNGTDVTSDFFYFYYPEGTWTEYVNAVPWFTFHNYNLNEEYYAKKSYTLTITMNDEPYTTFELFPDATIGLFPDPYKEGYSFDGWINTLPAMQDKDCTFNAQFTPNKYKLTYKIDGETVYSDDIDYGMELTQTSPYPAPDKEGYKFSGWIELPETMPAHDVEVTGTYAIQKYKLTYMLDGTEYKTEEVEYGATITPEADPEKEGYTFSGWQGLPETMPAHNVEVTGTYSFNNYKLTYKIDGETVHTEEVAYGTELTQTSPYAAQAKEGYEFDGWTGLPETMPAHDVEVTGTYTILKFKLTYIIDGETVHTEEVAYGTELTLTSPYAAQEKEGYTFSGWQDLPETMPAYDVEVTGTYSTNSYKLTYKIDGETVHTETVDYGMELTQTWPYTAQEKEGYEFDGWTGLPETMPAHDVEVTGTYTVLKFKLIYMVDGEDYKEFEMEYGAAITPLDYPKKDGYEFSGWQDLPETMPAHDTYVYGSFSNASYKLRYLVNGQLYAEYTIIFGDDIDYPNEPTQDGYIFSGWSEIPETMPAHDVEVTGRFYLLGDANDDSMVNIADIIQTVNYIYGESPKDFVKLIAALSGTVDKVEATDIWIIVSLILHP